MTSVTGLPVDELAVIVGRILRPLMTHFEAGPAAPWPRSQEGAALLAYQCSANKWTIAFGVRWRPDGTPIVEGDTITEDQVWEYTNAALRRVIVDVLDTLTLEPGVEIDAHHLAAVVFWVYNLGIQALKNTVDGESQLLPKLNAGRWYDAGAAMGVFVYATTSKDGKPWKRAMFGLFIRRSAEGCLLNGYDWEYACNSERLSLPTRTDWQEKAGRYYDVVLEGKTPFANVLRDAKAYPLELVQDTQPAVPSAADTNGSQPSPASQPATAGLPPVKTNSASAAESRPAPGSVAPTPSPSGAGASTLPKITPKATPPIATIQKPPSRYSVPITDAPYRIDPNFGLKPMEETERHQASLAQNGGMVMMRLARYGFFGTGPATVATFIEKDPIFAGAFMALLGVATIYCIGYCRKSFGDWKRYHAERVACQAMV